MCENGFHGVLSDRRFLWRAGRAVEIPVTSPQNCEGGVWGASLYACTFWIYDNLRILVYWVIYDYGLSGKILNFYLFEKHLYQNSVVQCYQSLQNGRQTKKVLSG